MKKYNVITSSDIGIFIINKNDTGVGWQLSQFGTYDQKELEAIREIMRFLRTLNPKLVAFVCKRFLFKMKELDYTSESEDLSELSFTVQSCFADYGLQVAYEKIIRLPLAVLKWSTNRPT